MKVLKRGREQKGWATEAECSGKGNGGGGCEAILLVEEDDLYLTKSIDISSSTEYYATFRCSECGVETDISSHILPGRVWELIKDRKEAPKQT